MLQQNFFPGKAIQVWLEFPDLIKKIKEVGSIYLTSGSRIFIELKASGHDIYSTLKRETNFNVIKLETPKDDKETRLNSVSPFVEAGRFILIEDTSNELVISEMTMYPSTPHDDVMDTCVYALRKYLKGSNANYLML